MNVMVCQCMQWWLCVKKKKKEMMMREGRGGRYRFAV